MRATPHDYEQPARSQLCAGINRLMPKWQFNLKRGVRYKLISTLPTLTGWTFIRGVDRLKVSVIAPFKWGLLKI